MLFKVCIIQPDTHWDCWWNTAHFVW